MESRMVHIYTGDGKGKTTCAMGLAARCVGRNLKAAIFQFLKTPDSGEVICLQDKIDFFHHDRTFGFLFQMSDEEKKEVEASVRRLWTTAQQVCSNYDLIVLDEVMATISYGFVSLDELISFLKDKKKTTEIVLTGRDAPMQLVELADYVSEIKMIKHPFEQGTASRAGIEY